MKDKPATAKVKHKYIFPNWLANRMAKVDMRTQYEASMMSMTLICIGLVVTGIYMGIYTDFATWYKIFLCINVLAGIVFMSSYLTTTYQQYQTYMATMEFQKELKGGKKKDE